MPREWKQPQPIFQILAEEKKQHVYDESKIKTLSLLEHIRLRTGIYIGRIGNGSHLDDGCYILLKEVVENAIDEFIVGHGKEMQIGIEGTTFRCVVLAEGFRWARWLIAYREIPLLFCGR